MSELKLVPVAKIVSGYSGDPDTRGSRKIQALDYSLIDTLDVGTKLYTAPQPAPEVEQEPVAWLWGSYNCTTDKKLAEDFELRSPGSTTPLYLHPQPAPEVSTLVEALEAALDSLEEYAEVVDGEIGMCRDIDQMEADGELPDCIKSARLALAAYHKQEC